MIQTEPVPIKKIGTIVTGKTPLTSVPEYYGGKYMFVTPVELHTDFVIQESKKTLSKRGINSIRSNVIRGLSIAVGCIGWDMGNVAIIEKECATNQQINSITKIKPEYNPYFLYYWLLTKKKYLFRIATVTRTPILNKSTFEDVLVPMPCKTIQDGIASLLVPISKKVSLTNGINTELEEMAKLLYDYWFVQFDFPNAEGKPYRASGGEMVYHEMLKRDIPKGWEVGTIGDLVSVNSRGITQKPSEGINNPVINQKCIRDNSIDFNEFYYHDAEIKERAELYLKFMDTLVNSMGVGTLGRVSPYILNDIALPHSCVTLLRARENRSLPCFLYRLVKSYEYTITRYGTGSTGQTSLSNDVLAGIVTAIPPFELIQAFEKQVEILYATIGNNIKQIRELTALRDFLLPLLMNGQVRVCG
jgi:type I restriction enzyme, S subunit